MVAMAAATASSQLIFSKPCSPSRLCPFQLCVFDTKFVLSSSRRKHVSGSGVRCMAVGEVTPETKKRSGYELITLTSWLLKQEQTGIIDAELTIVLSSISMACKQIASLVQRANISNLTGVQGAVNIQGEDQKKLDVVSNEVKYYTFL
jgi:fructose-1,6-bisphosphatase I